MIFKLLELKERKEGGRKGKREREGGDRELKLERNHTVFQNFSAPETL